MASSKLQQLKQTLGLGARANKYQLMLSAPVGPTDDVLINTICKGGAIPAKSMGVIEVMIQGRKLQLAGDAAFEGTWSLTFFNTQDHKLRDDFDKWLLFIDDVEAHQRSVSDNASYMTETAQIHQLNTIDNSTMAVYEFRNMWPTAISAMDMADDANDSITEFSVDFAYSHWVRTDTY